MESQIRVVKRGAIPRIQSVDQGGEVHVVGELRDFRWSEELREFMPEQSSFSASWVRLDHGEVLETHTHPVQSMMVVYSGAGEMKGDLSQRVAEGDVIVVPAGRRHGFIGGDGGLCCVSIQFGGGLYSAPERARVIFADSEKSLDSVLAYNDRRLARFGAHDVFALLEDGTLRDPARRAAFREALATLANGAGRLLVSCLAACSDDRYRAWLLECLPSEGRLARLSVTSTGGDRAPDPVLESVSDWFAHQMYVLDDVEKVAIVCLVFANAASMIVHHAARDLEEHDVRPASEANDVELLPAGADLLRNETPETYMRLTDTIREAWDMMDAAGTRIVELTTLSS